MTNLFILPSCLGDAILTTGAMDKFKDEPSFIIATPRTAPLFEDLPNLEKVLVVSKKPWKGHWVEMWQETRKRPWTRVVDFRGSALAYLLNTKERYVWRCTTDTSHKVIQVTECLKSKEILSPALWISEERQKRVKKKRPLFAVAPIPGWRGKQWPLENFITLLKIFCKTYPEALVAVFAAPSEREDVAPLLEALPKEQCLDTIGGELLDSAALIQSSRLFIGNDSGLMHLSAAVRTPTLALFGPSNEEIFGPWSEKSESPHRTLRGEPFTGNVSQSKPATQCYMTSLTIPPVWEAVQEMWEAASQKSKE